MTIKPLSTEKTKNHSIKIGGVSVEKLVKTHGSPLYVLDEITLRENCRKYTKILEDIYPNATVAYASKAGMTVGILNVIAEEGLGSDIVSGGEIYTALKSNLDTEKLYFHGNNKSDDELRLAMTHGIRIVIDNQTEVERIIDLCNTESLHAKVLVRLKPEIEAHTHEYIKTGQIDSKFGISKEDLLEVIQQLHEHENIQFLGIHGHIGSQIFDIEPYEDLARIMAGHAAAIKTALGIEIAEMNLGGGIGIQYTTEDDPPPVSDVIEHMIYSLKTALDEHNLAYPKLILEPGRSITATAGVTLYTIGAVKSIPGIKDYIFVDGGMADNPRFILYKSKYTFEISGKHHKSNGKLFTIAGKFCESGDVLGKDVMLPTPERGDIMVVYGTGAYNYAMASNYNRFCKPAMVMVNNGKVQPIVKRETYEDLVKNDV